MAIDISSSLRKLLNETEAAARCAQEAGDNKKAAIGYRRSAKLMRELVESAQAKDVQKQRIEKTKQYLDLAKRLETEEPRIALRSSGGVTGGRLSSSPEQDNADDLTSAVSQFVTAAKVNWKDIGGMEEVKKEIQAFYAIAMASAPSGCNGTPIIGDTALWSTRHRQDVVGCRNVLRFESHVFQCEGKWISYRSILASPPN